MMNARILRSCLFFCLAFAVMSAAQAAGKGNLEPAIAALKKGDAAAAIAYLEPLARRDDAEAQFMLVSALQGSDQKQANHWLRAAAENGQRDACHILGLMYLQGNGVAEDPQLARKWLTIAAEKGVSAAQLQLALQYRNGPVAMQDDRIAFKWMRQAAEGGNAEAQYRLAEAYRYGYGTAADPAAVRKWLGRAAKQGHAAAAQALAGAQ